jgi:hypothetical protein
MISMPLLAEDGVEVPGEFAVAVADQKAKRGGASWSAQANWRACWVTQCPGAGGVGGAAGEVDAAAFEFDVGSAGGASAVRQCRLGGSARVSVYLTGSSGGVVTIAA